ncbi:MAG: right-handed parallel beta-helix repeat-containing protein [Candidatus Heimdallarchaeota archaeon]|nr:right-handed parallel beta-helix repeat-containing protein [Candidatus Heimdallarchaeota archaeon]MCK4770045.1 right-handed parallel beta-helix repeat-containing protein [Candidatus Heimdallarchaeota archaeon]
MKGKSILLVKTAKCSFFVVFLFLLSILTTSNDVISLYPSSEDFIRFQAGNFITVESDADFISYGFPGSGNTSYPYIIENYTISGDYQYGINIKNTTKHFIIRNCTIQVDNGISVEDTANNTATIFNNTISCTYSGIRVLNSNECNISSNLCVDTGLYGIYVDECYSAFVDSNTCTDASENNIVIRSSPLSYVTNNLCANAISYGMFAQFSTNSTLINNTFIHDGLEIQEAHSIYRTYTVINNTVDGKQIGFFVDEDDFNITTPLYNQLYVISCSNVLIINQEFKSTDTALFVFNSSSIDIEYSHWLRNDQAFRIEICTDVSFVYNTVVSNDVIGSFSVLNLDISDNYFGYNNAEGIRIKSSYEILILNNTISNNEFGIRIQSSRSLHIQNNFINSNSRYGIEFHLSELSDITNNTISYNFGPGIDLDNTHDCVITYNYFIENLYHGVAIHSASTMNIVHHNAFINNNPFEASQALDSAVLNTWYDETTQKGNYWSDWNVSFAYPIDGVVNSVDLYPLSEPPVYGEENPENPEEPPLDDEPRSYIYYGFFAVIPFYGTVYALIFRKRRLNRGRNV